MMFFSLWREMISRLRSKSSRLRKMEM
ncbi:hypothetical protein DNTS_022182 [Danionella cerebrum]|uniref:Uncharacterized protein n=1 Tax=Danionella cerebrum TaxID=2873325 RepID=A0A553QLR9_9TELE|nr:hypothetical protein DNTS_022182 [Danionella translucida]